MDWKIFCALCNTHNSKIVNLFLFFHFLSRQSEQLQSKRTYYSLKCSYSWLILLKDTKLLNSPTWSLLIKRTKQILSAPDLFKSLHISKFLFSRATQTGLFLAGYLPYSFMPLGSQSKFKITSTTSYWFF